MPELPEVETVVRDLKPRLVGCRIKEVRVSAQPLRRPWRADWESQLIGSRIKAMHRRGKWIIIELNLDKHLVIHLGMTGQLTIVAATEAKALHTHVVFHLNRGKEQLRFRDIRRFGSVTLFSGQEELDEFFMQNGLGPEPFTLDPQYWRSSLASTCRCLKAVLLDQSVVAGVGNIYADEALFEARLHPARLGEETTSWEAARLRRAIPIVLSRAIDKRGSSIRNYVGGSGLLGGYQNEFRVYGRTDEPCLRCRTPIQRIRLAGRSTHFCPRCQPSSVHSS